MHKIKERMDVKRFKHDYVFKHTCECGLELENDNYLSYPKSGETEIIYFCCDECDYEEEVPFKINFYMEVEKQ